MPLVTHIFHSHKRFERGVQVSFDHVPRRANLDYDTTGNQVVISIIPTLSPKRAFLVRQEYFTLYFSTEGKNLEA